LTLKKVACRGNGIQLVFLACVELKFHGRKLARSV
jgi:hypothetical protein